MRINKSSTCYMSVSKYLNLIGCKGDLRGKYSKNKSSLKISCQAISGMDLKMFIHVCDICLYTWGKSHVLKENLR